MRVYQQDPILYRNHFRHQVGGELPGFKGSRHGSGLGSFLGSLARKAVPLLKAGVKLAAPHLKKAGKDIAKDVSGKVIKEVSGRFGNGRTGSGRNKKCKKRRNTTRRRKGVKGVTSQDIFMQ